MRLFFIWFNGSTLIIFIFIIVSDCAVPAAWTSNGRHQFCDILQRQQHTVDAPTLTHSSCIYLQDKVTSRQTQNWASYVVMLYHILQGLLSIARWSGQECESIYFHSGVQTYSRKLYRFSFFFKVSSFCSWEAWFVPLLLVLVGSFQETHRA